MLSCVPHDLQDVVLHAMWQSMLADMFFLPPAALLLLLLLLLFAAIGIWPDPTTPPLPGK